MQINTLFSLFYCQFKYELRDQRAILQHHWNKLDIATQDFHIYYTELPSQGKQNNIYPNCTCKICSDGRTSFTHKSTHFVHTHNKYLNTSLQLFTRKTN